MEGVFINCERNPMSKFDSKGISILEGIVGLIVTAAVAFAVYHMLNPAKQDTVIEKSVSDMRSVVKNIAHNASLVNLTKGCVWYTSGQNMQEAIAARMFPSNMVHHTKEGTDILVTAWSTDWDSSHIRVGLCKSNPELKNENVMGIIIEYNDVSKQDCVNFVLGTIDLIGKDSLRYVSVARSENLITEGSLSKDKLDTYCGMGSVGEPKMITWFFELSKNED